MKNLLRRLNNDGGVLPASRTPIYKCASGIHRVRVGSESGHCVRDRIVYRCGRRLCEQHNYVSGVLNLPRRLDGSDSQRSYSRNNSISEQSVVDNDSVYRRTEGTNVYILHNYAASNNGNHLHQLGRNCSECDVAISYLWNNNRLRVLRWKRNLSDSRHRHTSNSSGPGDYGLLLYVHEQCIVCLGGFYRNGVNSLP